MAADSLLWEQHPASDRYQEAAFREFFREALALGSAFAVLETATGRMIGSTRYHGYDATTSEIEVGWTFLARSHWGGRHNGEMKRLLLDHAFRFVERVIFVIGEHNRRSRLAVERIGAVLVPEHPRGGEGKVVYVITSAELLPSPIPDDLHIAAHTTQPPPQLDAPSWTGHSRIVIRVAAGGRTCHTPAIADLASDLVTTAEDTWRSCSCSSLHW